MTVWNKGSSCVFTGGNQKISTFFLLFSEIIHIFAADLLNRKNMSYSQIAQMEFMNAINSINSELELKEFRDMLAHFFAKKAQKAIDALWDEGVINNDTIEKWGEEHMRTPYRYEKNRSWYKLPFAVASHK